MRDLAVLFIHLITTVARLAGPGGARSVVAESGVDFHGEQRTNQTHESKTDADARLYKRGKAKKPSCVMPVTS
jgi:hypothetical protein